MMQSTFSSSEQWFIFTTTKTISAIYGYWWQYGKAPKSIEVYSGQCGSLTALYAQGFDNHADTINQFKNKFLPGTYYIKLSGFTGEKIALALGIELLGDNCPSPDCNLAPNFSFEDHPVPTAPIPWGAFENWAECWDNGSSHPGATPDYAIDPDPTCTPSGNGNRCIGTNNYSVWPTGTPGQHATAHFFVNHVTLPNRREYILTNLQNNAGVTTLQANRSYYVSLRVRNNQSMGWYNDALGIMFTEAQYIEPTNSLYAPPISNDRIYHSFTGANPTYNNILWRQCNVIIQNNGTAKTHLVIGNFEDNNTTASRNIAGNPGASGLAADLASIYIDHVEVLAMPDAGADITVCEGEPVTLGWQPDCLPVGVTYQWWDATYTNLLGTGANLTVNALLGSTTYILQVTFNGQVSFSQVVVTGTPQGIIQANALNQTLCNGDFEFQLVDYDPGTFNYSVSLNGLNATTGIDGSGLVSVNNIEFTQPLGMATVTLTATHNTSGCQANQSFTVYDCCDAQPGGIAVLNDAFSVYNQGTGGMDYIIYGSVTLDDNYTFNDCNFYLQPDAELVALPGYVIEFTNCTFQACNDFKWDRIYSYDPDTRVFFFDCTIQEGLRATHFTNEAFGEFINNTFSDNTLSQLIEFYPNASALAWNSNNYNLYALNTITMQHPQSTIPISSILSLPGYDVAGIKFNEVQDFTLENGNTFWADASSGYDNYLHVWLTQSSIGNIDGNTFNEGMNVYVEQASITTITNNYFEKSTQPNGGPGGIYTFESSVYIGQTGGSFSNYFLDGAGIACENPTQTTILNNYFNNADNVAAIQVAASFPASGFLNSSYVKIQHNEINNSNGILISNIVSDWQGFSLANPPTERVIINYNQINVNAITNPISSGWDDFGIHAYYSNGISIGENTVTFSYPIPAYIPKKFNPATKACGIIIQNSRNPWVGCNTLNFAGKGIDLREDVTKDTWNNYATNGFPLNYQTNTFASCFYGIYVDQFATISDFGEQDLAADNIFTATIGAPVNTLLRLKDARNGGTPRNYFYSGSVGGNTFVATNGNVFSAQATNSNNCGIVPPPSNKQAQVGANVSTLEVYPNPTIDWLNYIITNVAENGTYQVEVYDVNGRMVFVDKSGLSEGVIDVSKLASGVYVLRISNGNNLYVQRFARF
jgi:hypothetical protein